MNIAVKNKYKGKTLRHLCKYVTLISLASWAEGLLFSKVSRPSLGPTCLQTMDTGSFLSVGKTIDE